MLELIVCPVTKGHLEYQRDKQELISRSARLAYPVRDGIPILLEAEARPLTDAELGL
jgi:hypothetical protein